MSQPREMPDFSSVCLGDCFHHLRAEPILYSSTEAPDAEPQHEGSRTGRANEARARRRPCEHGTRWGEGTQSQELAQGTSYQSVL